jgi:predicted  nucleic acid-binding Zn-ribbon protein
MDLYSGKKEIRVYYKKLEDFTGFDNIDALKYDKEFKNAAIETIRKEMELLIEKEGISIEYITEELNKIEQGQHKLKIDLIAKQQNTASQLKEEIKNLKKRIEELEK